MWAYWRDWDTAPARPRAPVVDAAKCSKPDQFLCRARCSLDLCADLPERSAALVPDHFSRATAHGRNLHGELECSRSIDGPDPTRQVPGPPYLLKSRAFRAGNARLPPADSSLEPQ